MDIIKTEIATSENEGYVYIVANKYIPYLVKIGKAKDPKRRIDDLSRHEGVPGRFRIIFSEKVFNYHITESEIHKKFLTIIQADGYGEKSKEFYVVPSTDYAIHQVRRIVNVCKKAYKKKLSIEQPTFFEIETEQRKAYWAKNHSLWQIYWQKALKPRMIKKKKSPIKESYERIVDPLWPKKWWD